MTEELLLGLASIIILGILAQWLAWRLHLPAILLLLIFGFIAGPISGVLDPDALFGNLLFPLVSVSVALILFEGGLSLKLRELRQAGKVISSLTTLGIIITWILSSLLAHYVAGLDFAPAVLLGAILVVTGPTVIIPLLRQVRPTGAVGSIIKWEGIVNDPLGAILAVLVYEVISLGGADGGTMIVIFGVLKALIFGSLIGIVAAGVIVLLLKRYLIPDFLQNPVSLMLVVGAYILSDHIQTESGLLAVTVMGIALANQRFISIKHITEFKENLRVLLISSLFVILAARLPVKQVMLESPINWIFVLLLIILVRPAMVFISTLKSSLKLNEKIFLAWMAPRGIVAAAVVSVFALRLEAIGYPGTEDMVTLTFQVIIGTVAVYGLTISPLAKRLKISHADPQGVLFIGAQAWVREMARVLREENFQVALVDSNWPNVTSARQDGCRAFHGNVLSEEMLYELQLDGIGRMLAMTPNDEVNSLAALHFVDLFGSSEVYQLIRAESKKETKEKAEMKMKKLEENFEPIKKIKKDTRRTELPPHLRGRFLFSENATYNELNSKFRRGWVIKKHSITESFLLEDIKNKYGEDTLPLFIIGENKHLRICTTESEPSPRPGEKLISMVKDIENGHNKPDTTHPKEGKS